MRTRRGLFVWVLAGALGLALLAWAYPRAFSLLPRHWKISRDEAVAISLERLRDLGEPVRDPYLVAFLDTDLFVERRLSTLRTRRNDAEVDPRLRAQVVSWLVYVYPRDELRENWTYQARVSLSGDLLALRFRPDPQAAGAAIPVQQARDRADAFLLAQGIDPSLYGEPQIRSQQLAARTDLAVRFPYRGGGDIPHGVEVVFAGDRLAGFQPWTDDPQVKQLQQTLRGLQFTGFGQLLVIYVFMLLLAPPFLKRYHAGEIGVRRGGQIFLLVALAALVTAGLGARADAQGAGFGFATRQQTTWIFMVASVVFQILPTCLLAFFAWSVGESVCRERWGHKLAAFDALFQRDWANATVARSSLRGVMAGAALAGLFVAALLAMRPAGASPLISLFLQGNGTWRGIQLAGTILAFSFPGLLAVLLCLLPVSVERLGRPFGALFTILVGSVVLFPSIIVAPLGWGLLSTLVFGVLPVLLFLFYDLLTALIAGFLAQALLFSWPLVLARDSHLRLDGWLPLVLCGLPLLASLRALGSGREFVYRYEDIAPHVRRIAERERQRVELETARRIQSSILPELPPRLHGVEIAHAYLPASEVGGDFYDVLALEDGRLAVAVGDVAGHGVSSGLVMSMAKSALAVQVTFDPEVAAVFSTLNRMVHQTARKRLLATLCYLVLDPQRREMIWASAGHLFPYRVTPAGKVEVLESVAYPLGVRSYLQVEPRVKGLDPGDTLFLCSDGLIEARSERLDEPFGFERLEQSLSRHAHRGVEGLRDGVLEDVTRFTGQVPREDDQTVLVLRLP
ncbi:MAG TPA: PP2C family protein-serine/threonine phosphatase [Thermoanaerobaculia bacterium]|nr:PP2C family protein-serine/threonine phosphatase [Thermoanaerobaculia bacterium]